MHRCDNTGIGNPANGSVNIPSRDFGSVATYECDSGFTLVGNMRRTCTLTGWDGSQPTCSEYSWLHSTELTIKQLAKVASYILCS